MKTIILEWVEYTLTPVDTCGRNEEKEGIIRVPDGIVFVNDGLCTYLMNWSQGLRYNEEFECWEVSPLSNDTIQDWRVPMQLIKCKYEDIEVWEFFFGSDVWDYFSSLIEYYHLKLNDEQYKVWSGDDCITEHEDYEDYYKVIRINK